MDEAPHHNSMTQCEHAKSEQATERLDRWGVALSSLCAIHCLLTPFVFAWVPVLHETLPAGYFHWLMILVLVPLGMFAFLKGYRLHGQKKVLISGGVGFLFLALGLALEPPHHRNFEMSISFLLTVSGSLTLIYSHWRNTQLSRKHDCSRH